MIEPDETIAADHRGGGAVRSRTRYAGSLRRARGARTSAHAARARAAATRRLFLAADRYWISGDLDRATALLEQARAEATPGAERAAVLAQLAMITRSPQEAESQYRAALSEAGDDDALQATIHLRLASLMRVSDGVERGLEHGEQAVRAASRDDDASLRCRALAAFGLLHFNAGRGIPAAEMDEALRLERSLGGWLLLGGPETTGPKTVHGHQLWWSGEIDRARVIFHEIHDAVRARNEPGRRRSPSGTWRFWNGGRGTGTRPTAYADRAREVFDPARPPRRRTASMPAVVVTAHRGGSTTHVPWPRTSPRAPSRTGSTVVVSGCQWVLGFIELSRGDAASALPHLRRSNERFGRLHARAGACAWTWATCSRRSSPSASSTRRMLLLARGEPRASMLDRASALAILARCRGLVLAARGDLEGAFASFEQALAEHVRTVDPFQHARTLLALGRTQRRAKKRAAARATLEDALARFETLGAPLWAEQTRAELARIGGRAPSRGDLTEAEQRIALLVAEGHSNREVAAALFLTEHSVETALTRIYRKLGVRSRGELAHLHSTAADRAP